MRFIKTQKPTNLNPRHFADIQGRLRCIIRAIMSTQCLVLYGQLIIHFIKSEHYNAERVAFCVTKKNTHLSAIVVIRSSDTTSCRGNTKS